MVNSPHESLSPAIFFLINNLKYLHLFNYLSNFKSKPFEFNHMTAGNPDPY
jgi:hypothetical protein